MSSLTVVDDDTTDVAACDASLEWLHRRMEAALSREHDWEAGVDAALRLLLAFVDEHPGIARTWLVDMNADQPGAAIRRRCAVDRLALTLSPRGPALEPTLQELVVAGGIWALIQRHVLDGAAARLPSLATDLRRHVVALLGTPPPAPDDH